MGSAASTQQPLTRARIQEIYETPLLDLVARAATVHREHHDPRKVQCSTLLSIKTGSCPEDCGYCSQSAHHAAELEPEPLLSVDEVLAAARRAREGGADRFCMGAAWRNVRDGEALERVIEMVRGVKALGLETCTTLGMVDGDQAQRLREAGLDYYNHNLDTSPEYYDQVITTRTYEDRLETLAAVRDAGLKVCCGGIVGMGEGEGDRVGLLYELARQDPQPESVPINTLVPMEGTPLADVAPLGWDVFVRMVATARIAMPKSMVRLSAGREALDEAAQAMCFLAGANSIFLGDRLLTASNAEPEDDLALLQKLGLTPLSPSGQGG